MGTRPENTPVDFELAIRALSRRVDFLTFRVAHLETILEERPEIGWVLLSEESIPVESGYYPSRLAVLLLCLTPCSPLRPLCWLGLVPLIVQIVLGKVDSGVVWP